MKKPTLKKVKAELKELYLAKRKPTYEQLALFYLLSGKKFTGVDAINLIGTSRIAEPIRIIRQKYGYDFIETKMKVAKSGKVVGLYMIPERYRR